MKTETENLEIDTQVQTQRFSKIKTRNNVDKEKRKFIDS